MTLRIMIAGCAKDERENIKATIKAVFTDRSTKTDWNLSLVNIANQWSVEIDGPEPHFKRLSVIATTSDPIEKLEQTLSETQSKMSPPTATAPAAEPGEKHERHTCEECAALFDVVFSYTAGEPEELCPVASPACWHINRVPIAEAAGVIPSPSHRLSVVSTFGLRLEIS